MTYRTLAEAVDLTQDELVRGVGTALLTANETIAYYDIRLTDRYSIRVNREADIGNGQMVQCGDTIISQPNATERVDFPVRHALRQFEVCEDVQNLASTFQDQVALDTVLASKGLMQNVVAPQLINGTGIAPYFNGWESLIAPAMATGLIGASFALEDLDALWQRVLVKSEKMAWVGNAATMRTVITQIRTDAELTYMDLAGTTFRVPAYLGYPILRNDNVPDGHLYLANMDWDAEGLGLFLANKEGASTFDSLFQLQFVGIKHDGIEHIYRIGGYFAQALMSPLALGRIEGIATTSPSPVPGDDDDDATDDATDDASDVDSDADADVDIG